MKNILTCKNIKKKFGKKEVLKDISLEIDEGDILAFIGPNGSGKTTTIKLILGLQSITSGDITINGYNVEKDFRNAIKKVGAIVENPDSYMYMTGRQNLKIIANLYDDIKEEEINEIIKLVGLENRIDDKVSKYSLGMRQRLGIAKALINKPNLLILDEPTNGLDPNGIKELRDLLKDLASKNMGILISSHNLSELESFCNKVTIIESGNVIETAKVKEIKNLDDKYIVTVNDTKKVKYENIEIKDDETLVFTGNKEEVNELIKYLVNIKVSIYEVKLIEETLEEAYFRKTGGKID